MRKFKTKYLILLLVLSLCILINIIIYDYPMRMVEDVSLFEDISVLFWFFLLLSTIISIQIVLQMRSKKVAMLLGVIYYFIFFSINLIFKFIPEQTDVGSTSFFMKYLENSPKINSSVDVYFEFPIFFHFSSIMQKLLGLDPVQTVNIGFFLLILSIPMLLALMVHKKIIKNNQNIYFILPSTYLIFTYFFLNSQFVPQLFGLLFLIALAGSYTQLRDTNNVIYYYLTIFFFILCIYSHAFMFLFFMIGHIFVKLYRFIKDPKRIVVTDNIDMNHSIYNITRKSILSVVRKPSDNISKIKGTLRSTFGKYLGYGEKKEVSVFLLLLIYLFGYFRGFHKIKFIEQMFNPVGDRGETWFLISRLIGSKKAVGLVQYDSFPLYHLFPEWLYFVIRTTSLVLLIILLVILIHNLVRTPTKKIKSFDMLVSLGSMIFIVAGFLNSSFLGQRSIQATYLGISKYFSIDRNIKVFKVFAILILIFAPLIFTFNVYVNHVTGGNMFIEDDSTLDSGEFVIEYTKNDTLVFMPDRSFYPAVSLTGENSRTIGRVTPLSIVTNQSHISDSDISIISVKLDHNMQYYGLELDEYVDKNFTIYDHGDSKITYNYNKI